MADFTVPEILHEILGQLVDPLTDVTGVYVDEETRSEYIVEAIEEQPPLLPPS